MTEAVDDLAAQHGRICHRESCGMIAARDEAGSPCRYHDTEPKTEMPYRTGNFRCVYLRCDVVTGPGVDFCAQHAHRPALADVEETRQFDAAIRGEDTELYGPGKKTGLVFHPDDGAEFTENEATLSDCLMPGCGWSSKTEDRFCPTHHEWLASDEAREALMIGIAAGADYGPEGDPRQLCQWEACRAVIPVGEELCRRHMDIERERLLARIDELKDPRPEFTGWELAARAAVAILGGPLIVDGVTAEVGIESTGVSLGAVTREAQNAFTITIKAHRPG